MKLLPGQIAKAAEFLIQARRDGRRLDSLPDALRPQSIDEAHAIQDAVFARSGEKISAIKVGATKDGTVFRGILHESLCRASPAVFDATEHDFVGIEAEIAFRFPDGLAPSDKSYLPEVVAAAASALAAFDIVGTRFDNFMALSQFDRIADGLNAGGFVYGRELADWRGVDFTTMPVEVWVDGSRVYSGIGGHASVDPFLPVLRYVDSVREAGLPPGTCLTTGSFCGFLPVAPGQTIGATLGRFEAIEVTLRAADGRARQS
ncbi:2-keto-4-pentenoate hydratase [Devosia beringensis]|uniref:2-keto-4-pentenoate hydratase n=1 Tax=Devosia beringensis TaxID=2657486 RepID=UPI00186BA92E|nr:hypothetical protein [Devosia beringensis]